MTYREKIDQERAIKKAEEEIKAFEYSPSVHVIGSIYVDEYGKATIMTADLKSFYNKVFDIDQPILPEDYLTGYNVWI